MLIQCPLPIRQGVEHEGVVVVEEGYSRDEQHDGKQGWYGVQRAEFYDAPNDDEQWAEREVYTEAGCIAECLILEFTYDNVRYEP